MSDAPENIWAITEPDDVSADILEDVYAQQVPDGMNGNPIKYIREDVALAMVAAERERCARVAETSHERWHDELTAHEVECDYTACQDIAAAIRRGDDG